MPNLYRVLFVCACFFLWSVAACAVPSEPSEQQKQESLLSDASEEKHEGEFRVAEERRPEPPLYDYEPHGDCFGHFDCDPKTGVVTRWAHTPVPLGQSCPSTVVYTCKRGCRTDGKHADFMGPPEAACEEGRWKIEGEACKSLEDCLPTESKQDPMTGNLTNLYLRCDTSQQICVKADPPDPVGYMASCQIPFSTQMKDRDGYIKASFCPDGYCLVVGGTDFCLYQGCTKACRGTHECPQGSLCRTDISAITVSTPVVSGICKPGPFIYSSSKYGFSCY